MLDISPLDMIGVRCVKDSLSACSEIGVLVPDGGDFLSVFDVVCVVCAQNWVLMDIDSTSYTTPL